MLTVALAATSTAVAEVGMSLDSAALATLECDTLRNILCHIQRHGGGVRSGQSGSLLAISLRTNGLGCITPSS